MTKYWKTFMSRLGCSAIIGLLLLTSACGLFSPRTPEEPAGEGGTFIQPDAPDAVVTNMHAAIEELNVVTYRRSLHTSMTFAPTAIAQARNPSLWVNWGYAEENTYFATLTEAARDASGHFLRLEDVTTKIGERRYQMDATYFLVVLHRRAEAPDTVRGRLIWEIEEDDNGLWALTSWTDQQEGNQSSWSDLKAEFGK